jgi:hypothetical protein
VSKANASRDKTTIQRFESACRLQQVYDHWIMRRRTWFDALTLFVCVSTLLNTVRNIVSEAERLTIVPRCNNTTQKHRGAAKIAKDMVRRTHFVRLCFDVAQHRSKHRERSRTAHHSPENAKHSKELAGFLKVLRLLRCFQRAHLFTQPQCQKCMHFWAVSSVG